MKPGGEKLYGTDDTEEFIFADALSIQRSSIHEKVDHSLQMQKTDIGATWC